MRLEKLKPLTKEYLESIDFIWHTDSNESAYISDEVVEVTKEEAEAFYEAGNELYDMYVKAAEFVLENCMFEEIGIPPNLIEAIKLSWENDAHWHLYGRFDLAGGIDGLPIKLIEFNADTPTAVFETMIVQWALLKLNGLDESSQFNSMYEALGENFKRLLLLQEDVSGFEEIYKDAAFKILFTCMGESIEDENTTRLLEYVATEAGYDCDFEFVDRVAFSEDGVFKDDEYFHYLFKLVPWEMIALEEPNLCELLTKAMKNNKLIVLNPTYTLLFQSKGMLKVLWDLYPNHPLLLESSFEPLADKKQIKKVFFGREGANSTIIDGNGAVLLEKGGIYTDQKCVYQEFTELAKDSNGRFFQAGLFYAYEPCGLGFRMGGEILDNSSKFVSHIIK